MFAGDVAGKRATHIMVPVVQGMDVVNEKVFNLHVTNLSKLYRVSNKTKGKYAVSTKSQENVIRQTKYNVILSFVREDATVSVSSMADLRQVL